MKLLFLSFLCLCLTDLAFGANSCRDNNLDGQPDTYLLDPQGKKFCLEITTQTTKVGDQPVVTVRAFSEVGVLSIYLFSDGNTTTPGQYCGSTFWCEKTFVLQPRTFESDIPLEAYLAKQGYSSIFGLTKSTVPVICNGVYCDPEPLSFDFFNWGRSHGLNECKLSTYSRSLQDPEGAAVIRKFLSKRGDGSLSSPQIIHLYDLIPTDSESTFSGLNTDEASFCSPSLFWRDFCPQLNTRADYKFIERHLSRTYGVEVQIIYHRLDISYLSAFGEPATRPTSSDPAGAYIFLNRYSYLNTLNLPDKSIVHYAVQTFRGKPISDMTGGGRVVEISLEPTDILGMSTYSHEYGHSLGLPHNFYKQGSSEVFVSEDGIMDNTYRSVDSPYDMLSVMERYTLEPSSGFADSVTFVGESNSLFSCDPFYFDPSLTKITAIEVGSKTRINAFLNYSQYDISMIPIQVRLASVNGPVLRKQIVSHIGSSKITNHVFEIDTATLQNQVVAVEVDPLNSILDKDRSNNTRQIDFSKPYPIVVSEANVLGIKGKNIRLTARKSYDPAGGRLEFNWEQINGEAVAFRGKSSTKSSAVFRAPNTSGLLTFKVTVTSKLTNLSKSQNIVVSIF